MDLSSCKGAREPLSCVSIFIDVVVDDIYRNINVFQIFCYLKPLNKYKYIPSHVYFIAIIQ